jgi:ABC-2 type transport system permease protein
MMVGHSDHPAGAVRLCHQQRCAQAAAGGAGRDRSTVSRSLVAALETSQYFRVTRRVAGQAEGDELLARGEVQFVLVVPADFSRKLVRGERPADPARRRRDRSGRHRQRAGLVNAGRARLGRDLRGPLAHLRPAEAPYEIRVQRRYNPEGLTRYNIVPGLMGVILTMTMVMMTALAMTRERERGTMENLLATPVRRSRSWPARSCRTS